MEGDEEKEVEVEEVEEDEVEEEEEEEREITNSYGSELRELSRFN